MTCSVHESLGGHCRGLNNAENGLGCNSTVCHYFLYDRFQGGSSAYDQGSYRCNFVATFPIRLQVPSNHVVVPLNRGTSA